MQGFFFLLWLLEISSPVKRRWGTVPQRRFALHLPLPLHCGKGEVRVPACASARFRILLGNLWRWLALPRGIGSCR
jgi:hypothetical protein